MQPLTPQKFIPHSTEYNSNASVESLQHYVQQLAAYINENNNKYSRNIETVKKFYEQEIQHLEKKIQMSNEDTLMLKNQLNSIRDALYNKERQLQQKQKKLQKVNSENQTIEQKAGRLQKHIDQIYKHHEQQRNRYRQIQKQFDQKLKSQTESNSQLNIVLKTKEVTVRELESKIKRLESQIAEKYSLPEKIKQSEIIRAKNDVQIQNLHQRAIQAQKQRDFLKTENQKQRNECQKLRIENKSMKSDVNFRIEVQIKKWKDESDRVLQSKQIERERVIYELNEMQSSLKQELSRKKELQNRVKEQASRIKSLEFTVKQMSQEKEAYMMEFRKLKEEYQGVILRLQETLTEYQKKNWNLVQETRQLNVELDGLQELLREIKVMNSLEPLKKQYRQWAEMQIMAEKQGKRRRNPSKNQLIGSQQNKQSVQKAEQSSDLDDQRWRRMLAEVDSIKI